jgi:hypothetical protein
LASINANQKNKTMKKIIIIAASVLAIGQLPSCKSKTGDTTCSATGKYLADGKVAEYWLPGAPNGDTSFTQTMTMVTPNIGQQKNTYKNNNILVADSNFIPYYLKGCNADVYINNEAYNMDDQIAAKNYYIKGDRPLNSTWNFTFKGTKYWCGCNKKAFPVIVKYDTIWVDKIWMRSSPSPALCDTILWNDTIGKVQQYGPSGFFELYKKNF